MDFKNDFLTNILTENRLKDADASNASYMHFFTDQGRFGGPCYYALDNVRPIENNSYVWTPPCNTSLDYNKEKALIDFYNERAYFDVSSPWSPIINAMAEEMFEGYNTVEERVELVSKVGFVVGPKLFERFDKVTLCAFFVFWRRAFEFNGVRKSLKIFLEADETKDYPLMWNVFAAHHIFSKPNGRINTIRWENWHNNFDTVKYSSTPFAFLTKQVTEVNDPGKSWVAHQATSFMSGNSDKVFPNLLSAGEKKNLPKKFVFPETVDHSGFESKTLIASAVEYNQKVYETNVERFV